jgi:homoserine dehydrogenase
MAPPIVRVGLIGHGTVGSAFAEQFLARRESFSRRLGGSLQLTQIAVRDPVRCERHERGVSVHADPAALAADGTIDIVVEASGAPSAAAWIRLALERGARVVTAHKQALAHDAVLLAALARGERRLHCEAAVAAAVPVVRALRESLAGEEILALRGILNGTTTFVLSQVESGLPFDRALAEARAAGFAESDPTSDLSGADAAAKLAVLCTIAWRSPFAASNVAVRGIDRDTVSELVRQAPSGSRLRLTATAHREDGRIVARVAPSLLDRQDALATATGVLNVVEVRASLAGTLTWTGAGAGGLATASALLADTLTASQAIVRRRRRVAA